MKKKLLIGIVVAVVLVIGLAVVPRSMAQAAAPKLQEAGTVTQEQLWGRGASLLGFDAVTLTRIAQLLGTTPLDIQTQLAEGKTLVQIAQAKAVSTEQLVTTILAPQKEILQVRVKYGYLTQAQADQRLLNAQERVVIRITTPVPKAVVPGTGRGPRYGQQAPGYGRGGMMGGEMMGGPGYGRGGMMGGPGYGQQSPGYGRGGMRGGGGMMGGWGGW